MTFLIILFGAFVCLAGLVMLVNPEIIFGPLRNHSDKPSIHIMAVVVRFILGVLLITQAGESRFPAVMEILGWLSIFAALVLTFMGRNNFKRLMTWAFSLVNKLGRVAGVVAALFGAFIVYAFV